MGLEQEPITRLQIDFLKTIKPRLLKNLGGGAWRRRSLEEAGLTPVNIYIGGGLCEESAVGSQSSSHAP